MNERSKQAVAGYLVPPTTEDEGRAKTFEKTLNRYALLKACQCHLMLGTLEGRPTQAGDPDPGRLGEPKRTDGRSRARVISGNLAGQKAT